MSFSISSKHVLTTWHILLWFSVTDTRISSNFKIKHANYANSNNEKIQILPSWSYYALQLFPTKQLHIISSSCLNIQHFNDSDRIYKNSNFPSSSFVKDIFTATIRLALWWCNNLKHVTSVKEPWAT